MAGDSSRICAGVFVVLLLASTSGSVLMPTSQQTDVQSAYPPNWVRFDIRDDVYHNAEGTMDETVVEETRAPVAVSSIGQFDGQGLELNRPIPAELMQPRFDLLLLVLSNDLPMTEAREDLGSIHGLEVREYIAPSGLMVQGTPSALEQAELHPGLIASHAVPLGMLIHDDLLDVLLLSDGEFALRSTLVRLEGWRDDTGPRNVVALADDDGGEVNQNLADVVAQGLHDARAWDEGRYEGYVRDGHLNHIMQQPSVMYLRPDPAFTALNDQSRTHMQTNTMRTYFTTDLDGSGQIVAVADAGLDEDHGDFGTRVVGSYDVIGDGSTADKHSGHGTHVSCTVLGDGFRGGYGGVAQAAELYFQAMENDNTGNFQSPSLNNLLNTAYNANARTHTNSWGSSAASQQGKYNSETEDVDDRANYYDRYYNGREGLTILFAAGNDGPDSGTVSPPATSKNIISVGNHQNRYNGAPNTMMSGSSRGPTDDGRIKPDLVAPGGYVRSCRAQEAADTGTATWSNSYYLEYTGTSMATPNAAGAATMVREYLQEIAQRPSPQGALVKALLVLGAQDMGTRDIPNDDEGWGRINLRNTLAPSTGQGIWVDDRSVMSGTGNSKTYAFNLTQNSGLFKAVLTWSDERGSRFSNAQLVNDLDLEITDPDGTVYLGNDFANGRSTTGGTRDSVNNLEVVLIDAAVQGTWTVKVKDAQHSGSKTQPYAIAVLGHGVNDLRPDPMVEPDEFSMNVGIPQVGDEVQLTTSFFNFGNIKADSFPIAFEVDGVEQDRKTIELGAGATKNLVWLWTPQTAGPVTLSFIIDPDDNLEEIRENNNILNIQTNVTAPGVKLETPHPSIILESSTTTTTSWNITLTNTALIGTNASMDTGQVTKLETNEALSWYVGSTNSNFSMEGQASEYITVTLVHPAPPAPGTYQIDLIGLDVDNSVDYPLTIELVVPDLPEAALEFDYEIVPVHPTDPTNMTVRFYNNGNAPIGYDLFLQPPTGWGAGFTNLGTEAGATSGSTGLINSEAYREVGLSFIPPQVMTAAGAERMVKLTAVSQTEGQELTEFEIPIKVITIRELWVNLESSLGTLRPDSSISLMYSIEHKGNTDMRISPSFELPSGWSVTNTVEPFDLPWASTKNLLFSLEGNGNARSGTIKLNLDNGSSRFTWEQVLEVEVLPNPELAFVGLEFSDGTTYGTPQGPGSHPSGQSMKFTWLLSNDAQTAWSPSASLELESMMFGDCTPVESVGVGQVVPVVCNVLISASTPPLSEPSFTLTLADNGVELSTTIGLLVAENEQVTWDIGAVPSFNTGEQRQVTVELTNSGNTPLQRQLRALNTENWAVSVDGNDLLELEVGQSTLVRLNIRADAPGEASISLELVDSPSTQSTYSFGVTATGEPVGTSPSSGLSTTVAISLVGVVLVVAFLILGLQTRRNRAESMAPMMPKAVVQTPMPLPVPSTSAQSPICWSCRKPVTGQARGCPTCGARYHADGEGGCQAAELSQCTNCQASAEHFVMA